MNDTFSTLSSTADVMLDEMEQYRRCFRVSADSYDGSTVHSEALVSAMAGYSEFVTDARHEGPFAELAQDRPAAVAALVADLQAQSARCAAVMEKYRALNLLEGRTGSTGYFANVESSVEREFGVLAPTAASTVLLVGSGSFPMTLLNVAGRTGAAAIGVDVDAEAIDLGRRVVEVLGAGLNVTLEHGSVETSCAAARATHIVFSSTVETKYDLLHALYDVTSDDVVVALRFGDGLKSLFNYPMREVDPQRWRLVETVRQQIQVFDIAIYVKQPQVRRKG